MEFFMISIIKVTTNVKLNKHRILSYYEKRYHHSLIGKVSFLKGNVLNSLFLVVYHFQLFQ